MRAFLLTALITLLSLGVATGYNLGEHEWDKTCEPHARAESHARLFDEVQADDLIAVREELGLLSGCAEPSIDEELVRAELALRTRDFHSASQFSTSAVRLDPYSSQAFAIRGMAAFNLRKFADALHDLNRSLELNPGLREAALTREAIMRELNGPTPERAPASSQRREIFGP